FCLLTLASAGSAKTAEFAFFALGVDELRDSNRRISLSAEDIALLNPNTRTCPIFRSRRDAEITKLIYTRVPVIEVEGAENPWAPSLRRVLNETDDSADFLSAQQISAEQWENLRNGDFQRNGRTVHRVYEAKMIWHFDHRFATYRTSSAEDCEPVTDGEHASANFCVAPRYWYPADRFKTFFEGQRVPPWFLVLRRITNITNERTM